MNVNAMNARSQTRSIHKHHRRAHLLHVASQLGYHTLREDACFRGHIKSLSIEQYHNCLYDYKYLNIL